MIGTLRKYRAAVIVIRSPQIYFQAIVGIIVIC